jgi:glycosyltransferase involved in cell wall biosynthesis
VSGHLAWPGDQAVFVVIPSYNELGNLSGILARVRSAMPAAHALVADDDSPEGTGRLADRLPVTQWAIRNRWEQMRGRGDARAEAAVAGRPAEPGAVSL